MHFVVVSVKHSSPHPERLNLITHTQKNTQEKKGNSNNITYDLGGDVPLVLSNRVLKDGAWVSMPDGFPKMETQGGSAIFIFRFPKFNDNAVYDPIIGMGETIEESSPGSTPENTPESNKDFAASPSSSPANIFLTNAARPSGPMVVPVAVLAAGMLWMAW